MVKVPKCKFYPFTDKNPTEIICDLVNTHPSKCKYIDMHGNCHKEKKYWEKSFDGLAEAQHSIWSHWMNYMFTQGILNEDGSFTIPKEKVDRWKKQAGTEYINLTEREKESDRNIVKQYILKEGK